MTYFHLHNDVFLQPNVVYLCNDDSFLNARSVFSFEKCRPQVSPDGQVFRVRGMEPDVKVAPEMSVLVLDGVHRNLEREETYWWLWKSF